MISSDYRIGVDTGGTFTDVVLAGPDGVLRVAKAPTTPHRAADAVLSAVTDLAAGEHLSASELLGQTSMMLYGTTRATNAVVERKLPTVAFLVTQGFPDVLLLREGGKPASVRDVAYPPAIVPRYLTYEVPERIAADGGCLIPLDEQAVVGALEDAGAAGAEAIAVCLLWSVVNSTHESRIGELIQERLPGVPYTLSHITNPVIREYRRAVATVIDAALKPVMSDHIGRLEADLRTAGFAGQLMMLTASGGVWPAASLRERPVYSVGSGPSVAPVGAVAFRDADADVVALPDLIVCDTGGTTFDVTLVRGSAIARTAEGWLGSRGVGDMLGINAVDVHSIGAGGGSVARVDPGGLLTVGPESAGADPGPACYGRGGADATVTDAAVVLGYLDPARFLGGRLQLDRSAAEVALRRDVAAPLDVTLDDAAHMVLAVAIENSVGAIKDITVARGHDPRTATVVAGGGAAGISIVGIARALGCSRVFMPQAASALSAAGAHFSDLIAEYSANVYAETRSLEPNVIDAALDELDQRARSFFAGLEGLPIEDELVSFSVDARYPRQTWELPVELPQAPLRDSSGVQALEESFHEAHKRIFGVAEPDQYLECIRWVGRAVAMPTKPPLAELGATAHETGGSARTASAFFAEVGRVDTPRHSIDAIGPQTHVVGPAVLESATTVIVLPPGSEATGTRHGSLLINVDTSEPS